MAQSVMVGPDPQNDVEVDLQPQPKMFKQPWWRRSKSRGKYHENRFIKTLAEHGWNVGRRVPLSGPALGFPDVFASKDTSEKFIFGFFQLKPRKRVYTAYYSGQQVLSLLMMETVFASTYHSSMFQYDSVLVSILKGGVVYHRIMSQDILAVGLTDSVLNRITLTHPINDTRILQSMPSPVERSPSGRPLPNYYEYLGSLNVAVNVRDESNWTP